MKKIKLSIAVFAMMFALTSGFTTVPAFLVDDGYYADKDNEPLTEQPISDPNESEVNIDLELTSISFTAWGEAHCEPDNNPLNICAVRIVEDEVMEPKFGTYFP